MGLFQELRRRKVTRVAAVYVVTAWLLLQIVDVVGDPLGLPDWFAKVVIVLLAIGLPVALIVAWAFELTPDQDHKFDLAIALNRVDEAHKIAEI